MAIQPNTTHNTITRRGVLGLVATAAGVLAATPRTTLADTASDLADAQSQLDAAQAELDQITAEYETLSEEHSDTLDKIEETKTKIDEKQEQIDEKQEEIDEQRELLSGRISSAYKSGGNDFLSILLTSSSFEEFTSNIYYLDKITENDHDIIVEIDEAKAELDDQKAELEEQKADLEELSTTEQTQLDEMVAKQDAAQELISGLSSEVQELMQKQDEELAAQAAAAAAARSSSASMPNYSGMTGSQSRVVSACYTTPSPGLGYCAAWVSNVFVNAGFQFIGGDACDMYAAYCTSSDRSALQPGMIVAVSTHSQTAAGRLYGHIGIYVGGGMMMDNVGSIRSISVDSWVSFYGTTVTPRWGWLGGIVLS